jgi:uracil-DNA glycosylase
MKPALPTIAHSNPLAAPAGVGSGLTAVHSSIVACDRCPRLREYCARVAREKKRAYLSDAYWGRPVPGFGDPEARLLLVGLAPAAHGANRTGRVFTGDGIGGSGDFLMAALHHTGFANQPFSRSAVDGLELQDAYIACAVRCAPPGNTPTREEIGRCLEHLDAEVRELRRVQVVVALGKVGFDAWMQLMKRRGASRSSPRPQFGHGEIVGAAPGRPVVIGCYHPSRQNTNTGRLTTAMMREVLRTARRMLHS